jgi:hypothetical protein
MLLPAAAVERYVLNAHHAMWHGWLAQPWRKARDISHGWASQPCHTRYYGVRHALNTYIERPAVIVPQPAERYKKVLACCPAASYNPSGRGGPGAVAGQSLQFY